MSDIKTKFTLHTEYKDFKPRVTPLAFETLSPRAWKLGCLFPVTVFYFVMLVTMVVCLYIYAIEPLAFRLLGQETTAQVVNCEMFKNKVSTLSYIYTWESKEFKNSGVSYEENSGDCSQYLNQPIPIRVMPFDPARSRLAADALAWGSLMFCAGSLFTFVAVYTMSLGYIKYVRARWMYPRLIQRGVLIEGYITDISAYSGNKSNNYYVNLKYQFESPDGKTLKGSAAHTQRNDLRGKVLPPVGTPVTILYADDNAHLML